jgi:hypothetical protein
MNLQVGRLSCANDIVWCRRHGINAYPALHVYWPGAEGGGAGAAGEVAYQPGGYDSAQLVKWIKGQVRGRVLVRLRVRVRVRSRAATGGSGRGGVVCLPSCV